MADPAAKSAAVWLDLNQVDLVRAALHGTGLMLVGAGCTQLGRAAEVAEALGTRPLEDLRGALTTSDADVMLLASCGDFGAVGEGATAARRGAAGIGADDLAVLADRRSRGGVILTIEPMPASALQLSAPALTAGDHSTDPAAPGIAPATGYGSIEWVTVAPLLRRASVMRTASDVLSHLGPLHTVTAEFFAGPGEGSLGARLFDAIDFVTSLLGDAETVDAMYVWPGRGRIVHPVVGESLRDLAGVITANLRFPDGRAAAIACGDHSVGCGRWSRRVTLIGEGGRVSLTDAGFEYVSSRGEVDRSAQREAGLADLLREQLVAAIDPRSPAAPPTAWTRVLTTAGAALLSARTGEAESPETILRMTMAG